MAFNEVKECCKGHDNLSEKLRGESLTYIGKRHVTRLMCDAYGKGIVRGQAENTNLRANGKSNDVTAAECFRTCATSSFFGREYFDIVERLTHGNTEATSVVFGEIDARNPRRRKVTFRDVAVLYGQRRNELLYMSPHEFVTYWEPKLLKYPTNESAAGQEYQATLTELRRQKLQYQSELRAMHDQAANEDLVHVIDYVVRAATEVRLLVRSHESLRLTA